MTAMLVMHMIVMVIMSVTMRVRCMIVPVMVLMCRRSAAQGGEKRSTLLP